MGALEKEKPLRKSKPHTKERKKKISEALKGKRHSLEARRNMSDAHKGTTHKTKGSFKKGYTPWNRKEQNNKRKFVTYLGNKILKSRWVWVEYHKEYIPAGFVIHHINEDCSNDDIQNLRLMRKEDHNFLHQMIDRERYRKSKQVERLKLETEKWRQIERKNKGEIFANDMKHIIDEIFWDL